MWATLLELSENGARVRHRDGAVLELALELDTSGSDASLTGEFDHHQMVLLPGSTTDLLQAMEASETISRQREQMIQFSRNQRQRALSGAKGP